MVERSFELIRVTRPLCGAAWLNEHLNDYAREEIQAQSIQLGLDGRYLPPITAEHKRGAVRKIMRGLRNDNGS